MNRRWRGFWTQNTKDTIKFTICAVSFYTFKSYAALNFRFTHQHLLFPGEKGYDPQFFHYRVERVFIDDHNVPSLEWAPPCTVMSGLQWCRFRLGLKKLSDVFIRDMLKYTVSVREWMSADPNNIIAIHCKGGKGEVKELRLFFSMIICWLL